MVRAKACYATVLLRLMQRAVAVEKTAVKQIRAALERDTRINLHRFPINIAMQNGDLVLEGEVEDIAAKKLTLTVAAATHGIERVVDRLKVAPAQKMGDAEIRDRVRRALLEEPAFERCLIHGYVDGRIETVRDATPEPFGSIVVQVNDGVVTLNGEVSSLSHKRLAGVLAWWVPGSRDVINGLEEVPAEQDTDDDLTDAVQLVLEKDPFITASRIRVSSKDFIVTLEGLLPNASMKKMAERDAWYILGVREVINRIQIEW
ncbi:MAG TPA: BON domain-containing protein [Candidatus Binatia bacterium]|nr:BON domain-containing protein [Candidatus Binatia bacterium]